MSKEDPSSQSLTKLTVSSNTELSTPLQSTMADHSPSQAFLLSNAEQSLIQSIREATTSLGSSIHLSLRVDRKDIIVHCSLFVNYRLSGVLSMQLEEFLVFESLMKAIGVNITDNVVNVRDEYNKLERRSNRVRKLYKSRNNP